MLDKSFEANQAEQKIEKLWQGICAFKVMPEAKEGQDNFSIMMPPPNVTGSLHVGHALDASLQDILVRFERMRGKNVLWQPGLDHAGIATQMVVERQMAARGEPSRREMGREKFVDRVWEWKEESGGEILTQLRKLGASCDWSRERFTMDKGLCRAVVEVFVRLYRDGLIYKDKRLVNWDPKLLTAISDLEVESREIQGSLWYFRYPLADKVFNPEDSSTYIVVATTRPETLLGDSGVAVHGDDPRYKDLIGKNVVLPGVGRLLPVVADDYVDMESGSGAVKMTPAHDFNDFEVGARHNLRLINILTQDGRIFIKNNFEFLEGLELSELSQNFVDLLEAKDRFEARELLVSWMDEHGFLEKITDHVSMVPHGDRSGVVIEAFLTDQWYVNAAELAKPALQAVRDGRTEIIPENWTKTYFNWLEDIKPWCISRQLWWGHQIPAWYGPDKHIFVAHNAEEAAQQAEAHYGKAVTLCRDEDVLDTWFSSGMWPFSTLGWPDKTEDLALWYPSNVLVTGLDLIFFWVARMMMMGIYVMGDVPFRQVYMHALVRDKNGAKMSKSKGNGIDPLDLVDKYGADALRFTLASQTSQGRDIRLDEARIAGYRNFATKLWNASRFAEMNECFEAKGFVADDTVQLPVNRWILSLLSQTIADVVHNLEQYRYNEAAMGLYHFVWNDLCDWYLELLKPIFYGENEDLKAESRGCLRFCLEQVYKILHPFMPFLTESLWQQTSATKREEPILALSQWPDLNFIDECALEEIGQLIELIMAIRSSRAQMNVPAGAYVNLIRVGVNSSTDDFLQIYEQTLQKMARIGHVEDQATVPEQSIQLVVKGVLYALPIGELIDFSAEKKRLEKKLDKIQQDLNQLVKKLDNPKFVENAPANVVEDERIRLEQLRVDHAQLVGVIEQLGH